jgi:hypothetical protein
MRGLLLALFAFDFPGHSAGRDGARALTTKAKSTTKTTAKTV